MEQFAADLTVETPESITDGAMTNPPEVRFIKDSDQTYYVFYRHQLLAQYQ